MVKDFLCSRHVRANRNERPDRDERLVEGHVCSGAAEPARDSVRRTGQDAIGAAGQFVGVHLPTSAPGQVIKRAGTDRASVPIDLTGQFLDQPRKKYDIAAAGTKTVSGHPAHGLALTAKAGTGGAFSKATVWVDDDDSLIREFEATDNNGVTRHVRLTTLEPNATVDRSTFSFTPPKGVKIVDQTSPP